MPLADLDSYKGFAGLSGSDAARDASLASILVQAEAAVKKICAPYQFEPVTLTNRILDAPWNSDELLIPVVPVRSITSLYWRAYANGVTDDFEESNLLTAGVDYQLIVDDMVNNWSRGGRVRRLNRSYWGSRTVRPYSRLGAATYPGAGEIKISLTAGHLVPPPDVVEAIFLATSLIYHRRATPPATSEGWNGYSTSYAAPFLTTSALASPDVRQLLSPYMSPIRIGG